MIELKHISKSYAENVVFQDFSLSLAEGEITCILGESGSGKTTLLNILADLTPYEGSIEPRRKVSYVFQQPRLLPNLTVEGNLKLVCRDSERIKDILCKIGLAHKARAYPAELSGGQAQRVALARAFLYPAELALLDEPFSSLDLASKLKAAQAFLELVKERACTAVFVTHDADEALMLADRVIVINGGKVVLDFRPGGKPCAELFARGELRETLIRALLGKEA